jgi:hypothetical protein
MVKFLMRLLLSVEVLLSCSCCCYGEVAAAAAPEELAAAPASNAFGVRECSAGGV